MANDFSGDANCKALWRFENGALTADSIGTNTLTDNNTVGTDVVNHQEGAACADCESGNSEFFSITDGNLDVDFPFKNGDTTKKISLCFFYKPESIGATQFLFPKTATDKHSFNLYIFTTGEVDFWIGYNGGADREYLTDSSLFLQAGTQYHIGFTFDDSDKSFRLRVWDVDAVQALGADYTGNTTNNINIEDADLGIGAISSGGSYADGLFDEMVIFNDILSVSEIDEIRAQTYGAGGVTHEVACTDGISIEDTSLNIATLYSATIDGIKMTETSINTANLLVTSTDGMFIGDAAVIVANLLAGSVDEIKLGETIANVAALQSVVADGVIFSDVVSLIAELLVQTTDGVKLSESIIASLIAYTMVSDGIKFSDSITLGSFIEALVAEGVVFSDSTITSLISYASTVDGITITDFCISGMVIEVLSSDGIKLSDTILRGVIKLASCADGIKLGDSNTVNATFEVQVIDTVNFSEVISVIATLGAIIGDGITLSDTVTKSGDIATGLITATISVKGSSISFIIKKPTAMISVKKPGTTIQ